MEIVIPGGLRVGGAGSVGGVELEEPTVLAAHERPPAGFEELYYVLAEFHTLLALVILSFEGSVCTQVRDPT